MIAEAQGYPVHTLEQAFEAVRPTFETHQKLLPFAPGGSMFTPAGIV